MEKKSYGIYVDTQFLPPKVLERFNEAYRFILDTCN